MDKPSTSDIPIKATCHCGAITVTVPRKPTSINECQCTICRRYAAAWAYYDVQELKLNPKEGTKITKYCWGDRDIDFCFCETCGCVCYWYPHALPESPEASFNIGINTRMMDPNELSTVNREMDFNQLREPLKSKETAHPDDLARYGS